MRIYDECIIYMCSTHKDVEYNIYDCILEEYSTEYVYNMCIPIRCVYMLDIRLNRGINILYTYP